MEQLDSSNRPITNRWNSIKSLGYVEWADPTGAQAQNRCPDRRLQGGWPSLCESGKSKCSVLLDCLLKTVDLSCRDGLVVPVWQRIHPPAQLESNTPEKINTFKDN